MMSFGTELTLGSKTLLAQGHIGNLYRVDTPRQKGVLKTSQTHPEHLAIEAKMLQELQEHGITTPKVLLLNEHGLLMEYIETTPLSAQKEEAFALEILTKLHAIDNPDRVYGYYYNTPIGPLIQNNEQTQYNWALFLGQMRLIPMAKLCYEAQRIDKKTYLHIETLANTLYKRIDMSRIYPTLIHGDLWRGNILFHQQGATLIDPALYYADREMEIASLLMHKMFSQRFFDSYHEQNPLSETFYSEKVYLYQLYPLLLHEFLYPQKYRQRIQKVLAKLPL